ncbi:MAG: chemotaxis protein, partial [Erythrobacter sp.]|nr:chemotaxis protein [Erythrobacter sp.]
TILGQRDLMIREMNHRVKNLFSVISAMVTISSRGEDDVKEFATALRDRIHALGRSHALTTPRPEGKRGEVQLKELVETVLQPSRNGQKITMPASVVEVGDEQVTSLALIFHEWATNSAKYGALSSEDGAINVDWQVDDGEISIRWIEWGPASEGEDTAGFGTRLIETAARQLHGTATGEVTEEGYRRTLVYPTSSQ